VSVTSARRSGILVRARVRQNDPPRAMPRRRVANLSKRSRRGEGLSLIASALSRRLCNTGGGAGGLGAAGVEEGAAGRVEHGLESGADKTSTDPGCGALPAPRRPRRLRDSGRASFRCPRWARGRNARGGRWRVVSASRASRAAARSNRPCRSRAGRARSGQGWGVPCQSRNWPLGATIPVVGTLTPTCSPNSRQRRAKSPD